MTQSTLDTLPKQTKSEMSVLPGWQTFALCLLIPFALVSVVLKVSPNFSHAPHSSAFAEPVRTGSFGGDFLQEFVGGRIWSHGREKLYDWEYSRTVQHQSEVVGFKWKPESFFPMVYPPYHYQLASLATGMSYPKFAIAFSFFNALALSVAALAFVYRYRFLSRERIGWLCAAVLFMPLLVSLNMGQKSTILLAILTVTFVLLHREKPLGAGLIFGLIAFKPHFAILIGLTMLWKRQWWFVAGSLLTLAMLIGMSLVSPEAWRGYLETCMGMNDFVQSGGYQLHESHSLWGAAELLLGSRWPWLVKPLAGLLAVGVLGLVAWVMRGTIDCASPRFGLQFSVMVVAMILTSPHFYTYDLTILLLPLAICTVSHGLSQGAESHSSELTLLSALVFLGVVFSRAVAVAVGLQFTIPLFVAWIAVMVVVSQSIRHASVAVEV